MAMPNLSLDEEVLLLQFWALSVEIERRLSPEASRAIPGLASALKTASAIPAAIGWEDETGAAAPPVQLIGGASSRQRRA